MQIHIPIPNVFNISKVVVPFGDILAASKKPHVSRICMALSQGFDGHAQRDAHVDPDRLQCPDQVLPDSGAEHADHHNVRLESKTNGDNHGIPSTVGRSVQ
jgi:hypothetical protein